MSEFAEALADANRLRRKAEVELAEARQELAVARALIISIERDMEKIEVLLDEPCSGCIDLLAALKAFVAAEDEYREEVISHNPESYDDPLADAYKQARAAIAAAEGETRG
jgi:hypothetical protein